MLADLVEETVGAARLSWRRLRVGIKFSSNEAALACGDGGGIAFGLATARGWGRARRQVRRRQDAPASSAAARAGRRRPRSRRELGRGVGAKTGAAVGCPGRGVGAGLDRGVGRGEGPGDDVMGLDVGDGVVGDGVGYRTLTRKSASAAIVEAANSVDRTRARHAGRRGRGDGTAVGGPASRRIIPERARSRLGGTIHGDVRGSSDRAAVEGRRHVTVEGQDLGLIRTHARVRARVVANLERRVVAEPDVEHDGFGEIVNLDRGAFAAELDLQQAEMVPSPSEA